MYVSKEQDKPGNSFSCHRINVQWNNQYRITKPSVLLDLHKKDSFFHSCNKKVLLNAIRDTYTKKEIQTVC